MKGLDNVTIMGILQTKYRKNVCLKMIDCIVGKAIAKHFFELGLKLIEEFKKK